MTLQACLVSLLGQPTELSSCRRLPGGCGGTVAKVKAMQQLQLVRHRDETGRLPFRPSELAAATVASARARAVASARAAEPLHRAGPPGRSHSRAPLRAAPAQRSSSRSSVCEQGGAAKPPPSVLSASKLNHMALGHNLSAPQVNRVTARLVRGQPTRACHSRLNRSVSVSVSSGACVPAGLPPAADGRAGRHGRHWWLDGRRGQVPRRHWDLALSSRQWLRRDA